MNLRKVIVLSLSVCTLLLSALPLIDCGRKTSPGITDTTQASTAGDKLGFHTIRQKANKSNIIVLTNFPDV